MATSLLLPALALVVPASWALSPVGFVQDLVHVQASFSQDQEKDEAAAAARLKELADLARSKDPAEREKAAKGYGEDRSDKAGVALLKLGDDDDVLVQLAAIEAMAGRDSNSIRKLLGKIALDSPFRRVRRAAAEAIARTSVDDVRATFLKKASGKTARRAAEAILWAESLLSAARKDAPQDPKVAAKDAKKLSKMERSKDSDERVAAAAAVVAMTTYSGMPHREALNELLIENLKGYRGAEMACAALDAMESAPDPADLDLLIDVLGRADLNSVVERRLERATLAALKTLPEAERTAALGPLIGSVKGDDGFKGARLARLASVAGERGLPDAERVNILTAMLRSGAIDAEAAAAKGLSTIGDEGVKLALKELSKDSVEPRIAVQCIQALVANGELVPAEPEEDAEKGDAEKEDAAEGETEAPEAVKFLIMQAERHKSGLVKQTAAKALGQPGIHPTAVSTLIDLAKSGSRIELRNVATMALGRTRSKEAIAPLIEMLKHHDWMMRASAAEGLKQVSTIECVEPLLSVLEDEDSQVGATAQQALLVFSDREGEDVDPATWPEWWKENGKRARFRTLGEEQERREKYGYTVSDAQIYGGLDVVVIPGLGDHIELVLDQLKIKYRQVQAGDLADSGLHPGAILLVGCTGEIPEENLEVIQWYVRNGGALFTSCWALSGTVSRTFPAVVRKFPSPGEVVDNVFAIPTTRALESPYLRGVFDGGVQPFYSLLGAHLIQVVDPERAEVLLDSPYAAARHGSGDLAAYFRAGHGVILDTANHFEEQGFKSAQGLSRPEDRQAFAVNHMGLKLLELRELEGEKWWKNSAKAAEHVADLSVFRILTNFVREKRING